MEERFPENVAPQGQTPAVRLIFEYEGDQVRLVSQQPVDMAVTGSPGSQIDQPAYYVDTRDASGRTLARVMAHGAFATSTEVFPEQHGDPITRVDTSNLKGAFTVIAPATDETDHVTVLRIARREAAEAGDSDSAGPALEAAQVQDLASFPLSVQTKSKSEGGNQ